MRYSPAHRRPDRAACHRDGVEAHDASRDAGIARSRLEGFSDGVMAVAITLLVLGIDAPVPEPGESLWQALDSGTVGSLALFALSFAVIARFWMVHHDAFKELPARIPPVLVVINFAFLLFLCLIPFSTTLYSRNASDMLALVFYAGTFAAVSLLLALLGSNGERGLTLRALAVPCIFLAAIPLGLLLSPEFAPWAWTLLIALSAGPVNRALARRVR